MKLLQSDHTFAEIASSITATLQSFGGLMPPGFNINDELSAIHAKETARLPDAAVLLAIEACRYLERAKASVQIWIDEQKAAGVNSPSLFEVQAAMTSATEAVSILKAAGVLSQFGTEAK
jgi:hypothetical protein